VLRHRGADAQGEVDLGHPRHVATGEHGLPQLGALVGAQRNAAFRLALHLALRLTLHLALLTRLLVQLTLLRLVGVTLLLSLARLLLLALTGGVALLALALIALRLSLLALAFALALAGGLALALAALRLRLLLAFALSLRRLLGALALSLTGGLATLALGALALLGFTTTLRHRLGAAWGLAMLRGGGTFLAFLALPARHGLRGRAGHAGQQHGRCNEKSVAHDVPLFVPHAGADRFGMNKQPSSGAAVPSQRRNQQSQHAHRALLLNE
jgi:hypothetical protein